MSIIKSIQYTGSNDEYLNQVIKAAHKNAGDLRVIIEPWSDKRSLPANAQIHVWYKKIADQDGEDVKTVELFCKRMFGLPILMDCPLWSEKIVWMLDRLQFFNWPHEKQCGLMELMPCTRLFTTKQHNEYRDTMQSYYNKNGYNLDYLE